MGSLDEVSLMGAPLVQYHSNFESPRILLHIMCLMVSRVSDKRTQSEINNS